MVTMPVALLPPLLPGSWKPPVLTSLSGSLMLLLMPILPPHFVLEMRYSPPRHFQAGVDTISLSPRALELAYQTSPYEGALPPSPAIGR